MTEADREALLFRWYDYHLAVDRQMFPHRELTQARADDILLIAANFAKSGEEPPLRISTVSELV
jgi:hypothetical protein